MNDPAEYLGFAAYLGRRYGRSHPMLMPDDLHQVALIGLLEVWRTNPEAPEKWCLRAMRWAVRTEIVRVYRQKRYAETEPIDDYQIAGASLTEATAMDTIQTQLIWNAVDKLPSPEQAAIRSVLMPGSMRARVKTSGQSRFKVQQTLRQARQILGYWLGHDSTKYYGVPPGTYRRVLPVHIDPHCTYIRKAKGIQVFTPDAVKDRPRCRHCCRESGTA